MGLFDVFKKKDCEICGKEVGMFGYKKLEDGEICKDCVKLLSPWFDDRRHSTVTQIKEQLAYREENQRKLADFRPTKTFGEMYELKIELENGIPKRFVVAQTDDHVAENADLIDFKDVTSFNIDIDENEEEQKYENSEGQRVSYNPPRYDYSYDFYVELNVNNPYFDDIRFRLNRSDITLETVMPRTILIRKFDPMQYPEYREYKALCDELEALFQAGMQGVPVNTGCRQEPAAPAEKPAFVAAPAAVAETWRCEACGSENDGKFCQGCGSPKPAQRQSAGWVCFCGATNSGKFCPQCGTERFAPEDIECSQCSWTVEDDNKVPRFCPNCGKEFNGDDIR